MNADKKVLILSFITGAFGAVAICCIVVIAIVIRSKQVLSAPKMEAAPPSSGVVAVLEKPPVDRPIEPKSNLEHLANVLCYSQSDQFLKISDSNVKALGLDFNVPDLAKDNTRQPSDVTIQCRCKIENISTMVLRYELSIELLDKDEFILATGKLNSQSDKGDLSPGQIRGVFKDVDIPYTRAKQLVAVRITPKALKTIGQMQAEADAEHRRRALAAQAEVDARTAKIMGDYEQKALALKAESDARSAEFMKRSEENMQKFKVNYPAISR